MKKSNVMMTGAAALVALVAVAGMAMYTFAQDNTATDTPTAPFFGRGGMQWQNLTDEQKTQLEAQRQAQQEKYQAERDEINAAMAKGYDAWVTVVKKYMGENAPILSVINTGNFDKYVQAQGYSQQAQTLYDEIGLPGKGFGGCLGGGFGRHGGMMGFGGRYQGDIDAGMNTNTNTQTQ